MNRRSIRLRIGHLTLPGRSGLTRRSFLDQVNGHFQGVEDSGGRLGSTRSEHVGRHSDSLPEALARQVRQAVDERIQRRRS